MRVVIAYDVSSDGRRARLAALLSTWGDRIQRSVYECGLSPEELADVLARAAAIIDPHTDVVHAFRQCTPCLESQVHLGQAKQFTEDPYWIV